MTTGLLDELDAHDGVVVEEPAWVLSVGADTTDRRRQVDDDVRAAIGQEPRHLVALAEIAVAAAGGDDLFRPRVAKPGDDARAEESSAPGDQYPAAAPE